MQGGIPWPDETSLVYIPGYMLDVRARSFVAFKIEKYNILHALSLEWPVEVQISSKDVEELVEKPLLNFSAKFLGGSEGNNIHVRNLLTCLKFKGA